MSESRAGERPIQVTVAGWLVMIAGALLVVAVFDGMALVRSVAFRDELASALDSAAARQLGLGVDDAVTIVRGLLLVAGAAAAAAAVLGIYALQRHRGARIALTVLVFPILAVIPITGGMWAVLVAAGVALLWSPPARDWFAGRSHQRVPRVRPETPPTPVPPAPPTPEAFDDDRPPAPPPVTVVPQYPDPAQTAVGSAEPPPMQAWGEPARPAPYATAPYVNDPVGRASRRRPPQLHIACAITWVMSGIAAGLFGITALVVLVDPDEFLAVAKDLPQWPAEADDSTMLRAIAAVAVVLTVWALIGFGLAVLTWLGRRWARILLVACAVVTAGFSLLAFPMGLFHVVAAAVVVGLLLSAPVRRWFTDARPGTDGPAPGEPSAGREKPPVW